MNASIPTRLALVLSLAAGVATAAPELPGRLSETGLYLPGSARIDPANLPFSPQYALWSDGARKTRWVYLPPGSAIDATRPYEWEFPPGIRFWKQFGFERPLETRFIERLDDGNWRYATYVWNEAGTEAWLAPPEGLSRRPVSEAPAGFYSWPSREDCLACHEGPSVPVLGFSALQLSPDRDEQAVHREPGSAADLDLRQLVDLGLLRNLPVEMLNRPPRIDADSAVTRTALGYLHANCGHCHNASGPLALLEMEMAYAGGDSVERILRSLVGRPGENRLPGMDKRIEPGLPAFSLLARRMESRDPLEQMPPLGSALPDTEGIALLGHWISQLEPIRAERMQ